MIYFFSMQCPDCDYICFKQAKVCGSCGFNFKKAATSATSLFRNDSFTIFAGSKAPAKDQESSAVTASADSEEIAVMDAHKGSQENTESGEFLLNLSDAEQGSSTTALESSTSDSAALGFTPLEFGADANINLEEVEVEGLGLGLEPLEEEPSEPPTSETGPEESSLEISEAPKTIDLDPEEESSDSSIEIAVDEEPAIEITPASPPEDEAPALETNDLSSVSLEEETAEQELKAPVLDLGEDEIPLEPDKGPEPESSPPPPPVQIDELDLNLEIDDSDGPLTTADTEIPEIEIEDLGLELEDSDPPPDAEKS